MHKAALRAASGVHKAAAGAAVMEELQVVEA